MSGHKGDMSFYPGLVPHKQSCQCDECEADKARDLRSRVARLESSNADLLAALEKLDLALVDYQFCYGDPDPDIDAAWKQARAAIEAVKK